MTRDEHAEEAVKILANIRRDETSTDQQITWQLMTAQIHATLAARPYPPETPQADRPEPIDDPLPPYPEHSERPGDYFDRDIVPGDNYRPQ